MTDRPDLSALKVGDIFRCEDGTFRNVCVVTRVDAATVESMVVNGVYEIAFDVGDGTSRGTHLRDGQFEVTFVGDLPPAMAAEVRDLLARMDRDGFTAYGDRGNALVTSVLAAMDDLPGNVPYQGGAPSP